MVASLEESENINNPFPFHIILPSAVRSTIPQIFLTSLFSIVPSALRYIIPSMPNSDVSGVTELPSITNPEMFTQTSSELPFTIIIGVAENGLIRSGISSKSKLRVSSVSASGARISGLSPSAA